MMSRLQMMMPRLVAFTLLAAAGKGYAQDINCLNCHVRGKSAADFMAVYDNIQGHHPVDINYPLGPKAGEKFHLPNAQLADNTFFDTNGNGQPDSDEVQLFGANGAAMITCSSCHKEHGSTKLPPVTRSGSHLRVTLVGSELCSVCHNQ